MAEDVKIINVGGRDGVASEATLQELLAATNQRVSNWNSSVNKSTTGLNRVVKDLTKNSDDINDILVDFGDDINDLSGNISDSSKSLDKFAKAMGTTNNVFGRTFGAVERGLDNLGRGSMDARGALDMFGGVVGGASSKAGDALIGIGATGMLAGGKLKLLGVAATGLGAVFNLFGTAVTGAAGTLGAIIGMAQGFQDTFQRLSESGFIFDTAIADMIDQSQKAGMTFGDLASFVEKNRDSLLAFNMSLSSGTKRIVAMRSAMDQTLVDQFINLGVSLEEIPDQLAAYMALQGRFVNQTVTSDKQAIESAAKLFKQQKLLSDLTGKSVEQLQNEAYERTRATRLQAAFNEMVPEARAAYSNAAGIVEMFGATAKTGFEAVFAGDVTDPIYRAMISQAPELTSVFENIRNRIATGAITQEQAQEEMFNAMRNAGPRIKRELDSVAEILRFSGIDTPVQVLGDDLGLFMDRIVQISGSSYDEFMKKVEEQAAGKPGGEDVEDPMLTAFRNIEKGSKDIELALQGLAATITNTVGDESTGVFATMASTINGFSTKVNEIVLGLGKTLGGESTVLGSIGAPTTGSNIGDLVVGGTAAVGAGAGIAAAKGGKIFPKMLSLFGKTTGALSKAPGLLGKIPKLATPTGIIGLILENLVSDKLEESGFTKSGAIADILGKTLSWGGAGAAGGALFGGGIGSIPSALIGAAVGGLGGLGYGIYENWDKLFSAPEIPEVPIDEIYKELEKRKEESTIELFPGQFPGESSRNSRSIQELDNRFDEVLQKIAPDNSDLIKGLQDYLKDTSDKQSSLGTKIDTTNSNTAQMLAEIKALVQYQVKQVETTANLVTATETANRINRGIGFARA